MSDVQNNKFQQPGRLKVVQGSILAPHNAGLRFILNLVSLSGQITNNPLYAIYDKKWPKIKEAARGWYAMKTGEYKLGAVNVTAVQSDVWCLHLLCQDENNKTDINGLTKCLKEVCKMAKYENSGVHVSRLLTEAVPEITELLTTHLVRQGVSVSFYEEPSQ